VPVISQIRTIFYNQDTRVDWYLLIDHTRRIDFAVFYYGIVINFLVLAYCLYYPTGLYKWVKRYILILAVLDFVHLLFFASQGLEWFKLCICIFITIGIEVSHKKRKWQK